MVRKKQTSNSPNTGDDLWARFRTADGLFAVDFQQRIVHWSDRAEEILGYSAEEMTGKHCYEMVGGRDTRNHRFCRRNCPIMVNARRGRSTPDYDILYTNLNGEEKWLNMSVVIPRGGQREVNVLHLFRDVTHHRKTEEFARRVSAALGPVLADEAANPPSEVEPNPTPLPKLSRREMEVLRLLASGMGTRQIAEAISVRPITARNHISRLITKLGVENRLQAVVYASQHQLI
jgi:PAS domain S-box-containing protein